MSMARSTPAQNDRGEASTTSRSPAAAAHCATTGAARRNAANATTPRRAVPRRSNGASAVSTIARTTANGRSALISPSCADSMSTASAPVAASAVRSRPWTTPAVDTMGPRCVRRPARRSAPASNGADGHWIVTLPHRTSEATTTSPGCTAALDRRPRPSPPPARCQPAAIRVDAYRRPHAGADHTQLRPPGQHRGLLGAQRRADDRVAHVLPPTNRPSALIGKTSR